MSKEKQLRKIIREEVQSLLEVESWITRWLRGLQKKVKTKEFNRLVATDPALKKSIKKFQKDGQAAEERMQKQLDKSLADAKAQGLI